MTSGTHPSPPDTGDISDRDLLLAAAEAEAEAEAAEAVAAAARARARAATLRRRAGSAAPASTHPNANDTPDSDEPAPGPEDNGPEDRQARQPATAAGRTLDDDHADTEPEESRRHKRPRLGAVRHIRRRTAGVAVAAIVLCAGLGSSGYMMWRHHDVTAKQHREAEFVAAARQGVTTLTSLDFNHAADDVKRVLDDSTGAFRNDFQSRADDFAKVIQQSKVATQGRVDAAAVQSMTDDSAVVLVAATSEVTNSAGAKQEPRAWRLSVTVERVDGQLKMSKVEFVP
ncbi:hypothetical protein C5E44_21890 [Nocardia nova]|uniref:hypothetical protein n=1 Tax=Nocardia nova TaxID=37330 RepID=UPI000CE9B310|nr:hypothetical protein C5E44_21890 [Nocardia nova]